jgi:hypothetical protein
MRHIFHKAKNKKAADEWDIQQQISMTADQRFAIAAELKRRGYGPDAPDIRTGERLNGRTSKPGSVRDR